MSEIMQQAGQLSQPPPPPCTGCGGIDFVTEKSAGDVVCNNCGEVAYDRIIDFRPEWKSSNDENTKTAYDTSARCSRLSDNDVQNTFIVGGSATDRTELTRSHVKSALSSQDTKFIKHSELVKTISHRLGIQDQISGRAVSIFRQSLVHPVSERTAVELIAAASIYIASRVEGFPRTVSEIASIAGVDKSSLGSYYINLAKALEIDLGRVLPEQFISRLVSSMTLHCSLVEPAVYTCRQIMDTGVVDGACPNTIAGVVVLVFSIACDCSENLHMLEDLTFSSAKMIKQYYKLCYPVLSRTLPTGLPASFVFSRLPTSIDQSVKITCDKSKNAASSSVVALSSVPNSSSSSRARGLVLGSISVGSNSAGGSPPLGFKKPLPLLQQTPAFTTPPPSSSTSENKRTFSTSTSKGGWGSLKKSKSSPKSL